MTKIKLCCLLLFLIGKSAFGQYPVIHENRPRIYTDSARLAWLKHNITVAGDCKDTYTNFLFAYNNYWINDPELYLLGSDSSKWTWKWSSPYATDQAKFTIFLYKINNDSLALKRCRYLARRVTGYIDSANFSTMEYWAKENMLRQMSDVCDLLLDWCYNDFTDSLKQALAKSAFNGTREFMKTYILSASGNNYVSSHNPWNTIFCNQNILTLHNALGITAAQNDTLQQWFKIIYDKWENGFLPAYGYYRDDDGGWNWGAAYSMWSLTDQFQMFENMRIGSSKNYYTDVPWVKNSINQYWYFIQPDNKTLHLGDGLTHVYAADRVDYLHARIYDDARSKWRAQIFSLPVNTPNTNHKFWKLLYKDFTAAAISMPGRPLNWWADKVGLSVSRSSWQPDAVMVSFFNSPSKRSDHEHRDNNSFTVFKNAPLLIDAGHYDTYAGTHYRNYYQRTIAHNSICVFDSTEQYTNFGLPASNDGGQIESTSLVNYNEIFQAKSQRGKWIKYAATDNYVYHVSDAQLSYDSAKLNFFRRRFLYLKPGKLIVLDNVHLKNRATKQRDIKWLAHFAKKPVVNGSLINAQVPGHIETYNGNSCTAKNGNGSVAIKTLWPVNTTTTLIGGNGYQYWVNGINYPPLAPPDTSFYTPGSWRIEVRPSVATDTTIYLNTIDIGDTIQIAKAGGIALKSDFSIGADWNDTLYYFSLYADTGKTYHVFENVAGGRTTGIFAADLKIGMYDVKVDGIVVVNIKTDTNGILQTAVQLSAGVHKIEIAEPVLIIQTPVITSFSIYPNPVTDVLNIQVPASIHITEIIVYDAQGRLVLSSINNTRLNVAQFPGGLYFIRIKQNDKIFTAKFIKY